MNLRDLLPKEEKPENPNSERLGIMSSLIRFHGGTKQSITESPKILESCSFAWMRSFFISWRSLLGPNSDFRESAGS